MVFFLNLFQTFRCYLSILFLRFEFLDLDRYDSYFRSDSVMTLAQAGRYEGVDDIREYVNFGHPVSPFIADGPNPIADDRFFGGYDWETGQCKFTSVFQRNFKTSKETTAGAVDFNNVFMINLFLDLKGKYISKINLFYPLGFLDYYFADLLNSNSTRNFICDLMSGKCEGLVSEHDEQECPGMLDTLPASSGEKRSIDGNSQGCRVLHSAFAQVNPENHCAHISFDAREDPKNRIKCQESENISPEDLFSLDDFAFFEKFARKQGFDPEIGYIENSRD